MIAAALLLLTAAQWPEDARGLLAWHDAQVRADAAAAPDAAALRDRLYGYLAAGAEGEAWKAAARLEALAPGDADGERYRIQLSVWDPGRWSDGLERARRWLREHGARPEAERRNVEAALATLDRRVAARAAHESARGARAWVPAAALIAFLAGAALALRAPRDA